VAPRLSRITRSGKRTVYAEIQNRHEQTVRAAAKEEKRKPKRSLDEITEDIKRKLNPV
jgi:hypothetical protein